MSLLDDVSIVVTPNGYKAGTLFAVKPTDVLGAEEITNGDFSNGLTGWTENGGSYATIVSGALNSNNPDAGNWYAENISQNVSFVNGTTYKLTFKAKNISGNLNLRITQGANAMASLDLTSTFVDYTYFYTANADNGSIRIFCNSAVGQFQIDDISIKENTGADMDVTRATAATRVDEDGLVNYAEIVSDTELVTNGDFVTDTDWTKGTGWTISGGNLNASNVNAASTTQAGYTFVGKTFQVSYTISDYSQGGVRIYLGGSQSTSLKSANGTHTETISISSGNTLVYIYGTSNFTGNIDNVSIKEVTRDNVPRIDYTGGGCPHILVEPQRTNLLPYSEDFSQTDWQKIKSSVASGFSSPDGGSNAYRWQEDTNSGVHSLKELYSFNSVDYSQSIFIKPNGRSNVSLWVDGASKGTKFDLSSGTIYSETSSVGKITAMNDGWFKISTTVLGTSGTAFNLYGFDNSWNISYTGDGTSGFYVYGAQLEEGSYATSYIPTSGSTVTRNQDIFTRDGIGSLINSTEGVLFVEMAALANDGVFRIISLSDGGTTNRVSLIYNTSSNSIRVMVVSTSTVFDTSNSVTSTLDFHKIAIKWKLNDFAVWIDGVEVATDTSGATPIGLDRIVFDVGDGSLFPFFGKVKQLQVYDTALTDTQLAALTS